MSKIKIVSPKAELTVLQSLCNQDLKISGAVLSQIDESYFYEPLSKELFNYIKAKTAESISPPKPRQIMEDPEISDDAKEYFKTIKTKTDTVDEALKNVQLLNKYRRTRLIYELSKRINDAFENEPRLNIDKLTMECAELVSTAQASKSNKDAFVHLGTDDNAKDLLYDCVYGEDTSDIIPTGLTSFDKLNGGFNRGALVTIGAPSGCGKSMMANQLAINFAKQGYKVVIVPLEMSKKEMSNRVLANVANIELSKIRQHKLDEKEKVLVTKRQKRFRKLVNSKGGRLTIFRPAEDLDIDELFASISSLDCDVVIIDYISLLKGIDDDNQWLRLGTMTRKAKINAELNNRVNIVLCQVSDEGKIRYSGAIREHSESAWIWTPSKEERQVGIIKIEQIKSRNAEPFPFNAKFIWNKMMIESIDEDIDVGEPTAMDDTTTVNLASDI